MTFTVEEIAELKQIFEKECGVRLSEAETIVIAKRVLLLYQLVAHPLSSEGVATPKSSASAEKPTSAASGRYGQIADASRS